MYAKNGRARQILLDNEQNDHPMQGDLRVTVSLYPAMHAGIRTKKRKGRDGRKTIAEPRRNRLDTYRRISPEDSAPRV